MPGILHLMLGLIVALAIRKIAQNPNNKSNWSFTLVLVFMVNSYMGPDFGNLLHQIAKSIESEWLYRLGSFIHSYLGFVLFTLLSAPIWYQIVKLIEKAQIKYRQSNMVETPLIIHSYPDVHLIVLIGGIFHHFTDLVGHSAIDQGGLCVKGEFTLWPLYNPILAITLVILYGLFALILFIILVHNSSVNLISIKQQLITFFQSKSTKRLIFFIIIAIINSLLMFSIMAIYGNTVIETKELNFGIIDSKYMFNWGMVMASTQNYHTETNGDWYSMISVALFFILFSWAHITERKIKIKTKNIRIDKLVMYLFIILILIGYLLQPFIGNISREEFDFGAFIGLWSSIGFVLIGAGYIKGTEYINYFCNQENLKSK